MKNMRLSFLFTFLIMSLMSFVVEAQNYTTKKTAKGKVKKIFDKGMKHNMLNKNSDAIREFERALKIDPTFIDAQIQWAALHYHIKKYPEAEIGFEKVLAIDDKYNNQVLYSLGLCELRQKKYQEAHEHFKTYQEQETKNETLLKKAKYYEKTSLLIHNALNNPVPFEPKSMGDNINTKEHGEYLPSLTADGLTMVYTKNLYRENEEFYVSRKVDGEWTPSQPIKVLNTMSNEGAQSISADGKVIVFTDCGGRKGYGSCDLFFSEFVNGEWTPAKNIRKPVNSANWEAMPSISANGTALYFSSSRGGGEGKSDIWVSYRKADGKWGAPENLGPNINTENLDQSPFIHPDGQTLYFMSNGHPGMGGFDLYYSRRQADGTWGEAQNLGYPINTDGDEGALIISLDGKTAYFASNTKDLDKSEEKLRKRGNHDLYQFELYPEARPQPVTYVKAKVFDVETKEELIANIEFIELSTGKTHVSAVTDRDGEFLICLPIGSDYALNVSKTQYLFHSENFALAENSTLDEPILLKIGLQPIREAIADGVPPSSKPIILKNVFFETAKADLLSASINELTRLKQLLLDNPQLNIQINGHTDNVGSEADNLSLSDARAEAVYQFLIENGIEQTRLRFKGFGESQPIDSNDTELGRQNNRRTEFMVIN